MRYEIVQNYRHGNYSIMLDVSVLNCRVSFCTEKFGNKYNLSGIICNYIY